MERLINVNDEEAGILDITRGLSPAQPEWPGDTPFSLRWTQRMEAGGSVNLSALTFSPHCATHLDAPLHFSPGGAAVDEVPPGRFVGPCLVVDARGDSRGQGRLAVSQLERRVRRAAGGGSVPPRVLMRTGYCPGPSFDAKYTAFSAAAVRALAARGARLLGTDAPSIDPFNSTGLPAHRACAAADICILEHLELAGVQPGFYRLAAAPMLIEGAEAAPVRALLFPVGHPGREPRNASPRTGS